MRARRRQAQRPRQCRLHRAPSHLLRDARQLLVRRLLQGSRDRARLEPGHEGIRPAEGQADGHRLYRRRRGLRSLEEDRRPAGVAHHPHRRLGQFLADGRHGPVRSVLGNLLRPWRQDLGRPAGLAGGRWRPFHRDLESRVHAVRAARRRPAQSAAEALDRHRRGARARRGRAAGRARQLRHRSVRRADPCDRGADRRRSAWRAEGLAARDRRPSARLVVPDRGRRAALERGPRLCAAPDHAPRDAPCAASRRARAAHVSPGLRAGARDGAGLSGTGAGRRLDQGDAAAGGDALPQDAGARAVDPRREVGLPEEGRHVRRRHRVHALRHLRLPARPDPGRAEVARHRRRSGGVHRCDEPPAREGARGLGRLAEIPRPKASGFRCARSSAPPNFSATRPRPPRAW